jgi:hypothetical protein
MKREDVIRMAQEVGAGLALTMSSPEGIAAAEFRGQSLERFAALVAAHVLTQRAPSIVLSTADIDPALLHDMLTKAKPMPLVAMPPEPDVAAAVRAEREACAQLCDMRMQQSRNHLVRSGLKVAALDIRARGTPQPADPKSSTLLL